MKTYKVTEDWNTFQQFVIEDLNHIDKNSIGFLHRGNEIYIRCQEESILKLIRKKFKLIPCKQPNYVLDKEGAWLFAGNTQLFDIIF
jgi:hypothetical protein